MQSFFDGFVGALQWTIRTLLWVLKSFLIWTCKSRLIVALVGVALMWMGLTSARLIILDGHTAAYISLVGAVVFVGGLLLFAGSFTRFILLGASMIFFIVLLSIPERFGAWNLLLFPGDVGVPDFWPSVRACLLFGGIAVLFVWFGRTRPHGHN